MAGGHQAHVNARGLQGHLLQHYLQSDPPGALGGQRPGMRAEAFPCVPPPPPSCAFLPPLQREPFLALLPLLLIPAVHTDCCFHLTTFSGHPISLGRSTELPPSTSHLSS